MEIFISEKQVADILGVSRGTVKMLRYHFKMPCRVARRRRAIVFNRDDVVEFAKHYKRKERNKERDAVKLEDLSLLSRRNLALLSIIRLSDCPVDPDKLGPRRFISPYHNVCMGVIEQAVKELDTKQDSTCAFIYGHMNDYCDALGIDPDAMNEILYKLDLYHPEKYQRLAASGGR